MPSGDEKKGKEKETKELNYNQSYQNENKDNVEALGQSYKNAYDIVTGKATSMKVLSGIAKYTGIGLLFAPIVMHVMKKNARDNLLSAQVKLKAAEAQKKDYQERESNLEEENVKIQEEMKPTSKDRMELL